MLKSKHNIFDPLATLNPKQFGLGRVWRPSFSFPFLALSF